MVNGVRVVGGSSPRSDRAATAAGGGDAAAGDGDGDDPVVDAPVAGSPVVDAPVAGSPVVDAPAGEGPVDEDGAAADPVTTTGATATRRPAGREQAVDRRRRRAGVAALAVLAVLGVGGTVGFGLAWDGLHNAQSGESQARDAARSFLVDLTNFNAKTVDADFSAVSSMATGPFAAQAQKFFNSAIRQDLQKALASSRGQIRALYVQSYGGGSAAVYSVIDQLYVNDKLTSPQTDVLRIVVDLSQVAGRWKVSNVTVLQGPSIGSSTPSSANGSSTSTGTTGSAGSAKSTGSTGTSTPTSTTAPASSGG